MELTEEMLRLSKLLDAGLAALRESSKTFAEADHAYHKTYAEAFLRAEGAGVVREQEATSAALQARLEMRLSEGVMKSASAAIQARRTQISALQSLMTAYKAEAEFARTGPQ